MPKLSSTPSKRNPVQDPVTPTRNFGDLSIGTGHGHVDTSTADGSSNPVGVDSNHQPHPQVRPLPNAKLVTPHNQATSLQSHSRSGHTTAENLRPYIEKDIMLEGQRIPVFFHTFLKYMLRLSAKPGAVSDDGTVLLKEVLNITTEFCNNDPRFKLAKVHLDQYCQPKEREQEGYQPLVECINKLLEALSKDVNFPSLKAVSEYDPVLHENDPKEIKALYDKVEGLEHTSRKPDLVFIAKLLLDAKKGHMDVGEKPTLEWADVLTTWEVKLECKNGFTKPPSTYPKKDFPETHRLFHDKDIKKEAECASKRYCVDMKGNYTTKSDVYSDTHIYPKSSGNPGGLFQSNTSSNHGSSKKGTGKSSTKLSSANRSGPANQPKLKPNGQNALYGAEMLCRGIYSLHSINVLIVDDVLWLWYFDRQNAIQTTGLNFVKDMPFFLALLVAFQRFDKSAWGVDPSLAPPSMFTKRAQSRRHSKVDIAFDNGVSAIIDYKKMTNLPAPVLKGRATRIIDVESTSVSPPKGDLVIKAYWPEIYRDNEANIITKARAALVNDSVLSQYLPELIASMDIPSSETDLIRDILGVEAATKGSDTRVLRLLLFRKLLPMDNVEDEGQFTKGWLHAFKCHYALWQKGCEHGDISVWNIMWDEKNRCGILNDWDLAYVCEKEGEIPTGRGRERTGTLPFMARDLFEPDFMNGKKPRLYRHEVESFIWVFSWVCIKYDHKEILDEWRQAPGPKLSSIANAKFGFLGRFPVLEVTVFQNAWGKCKLLLHLLSYIDTIVLRLGKVPVDELLYKAVLKIMNGEITDYSQFFDAAIMPLSM